MCIASGRFEVSDKSVATTVVAQNFAALLGAQSTAQKVSAQDYSRLGISLAKEGELPEAEQELDEAVRVAPVVALYRAQLGCILRLRGKWKAALCNCQNAVELAPANIAIAGERLRARNGSLASCLPPFSFCNLILFSLRVGGVIEEHS